MPRCRGDRCSWLLLLLLGAAVFALATGSRALADGTASVTPGGGDMHTTYIVEASGLAPGDAVLIVLLDGAGSRFTYQQNGVDLAVVADANGNASMTVTPATDLTGAVAGNWTATLTDQASGATATLQFYVTP